MTDVQFFIHMYDVKHALELAGVKSFRLPRHVHVGGGTKRDIDRFLENEQIMMVAGMAKRVFTTQCGGFASSKKNHKYKLFKRPVVMSLAVNGKLVDNGYMVLTEDSLQGAIAQMNREQVRKMKEAIVKAHTEIKAARG